MKSNRRCIIVSKTILLSSLILAFSQICFADEEYTSFRAREAIKTYKDSPISQLSMDYFARFNRDVNAKPTEKEMLIGKTWKIVLSPDAKPLTEIMAGDLMDFLNSRMEMNVSIEKAKTGGDERISLIESGGGDTNTTESFTISADAKRVVVQGKDINGLREGVVKLVNIISLRQAPILEVGSQVYKPRMAIRVGEVPWMGSYRDLVFNGYNAAVLCGAQNKGSFTPVGDPSINIYALSAGDAIPELNGMRNPTVMERINKYAEGARKYNLGFYVFLTMEPAFEKDCPAFKAHPDIQGAWMYDYSSWYEKPGKYILCTESPLVQQYLSDTIQNIFKSVPDLSGIGVIIGGEVFHHCFMRPYGVEKGHTNCKRCEALGHDVVVANLCNNLAAAARKVNPEAEVFAWPYSASYVWSIDDKAQLGFISRLKPGVALFADIVKDDTIDKGEGVKKVMWDYSIDLPGPGTIAKQQLKACRDVGIHIHYKTEPELAFEAAKLIGIPCMDRWAARANAMATSGEDGAWVFPWFIPNYGTSTSEIFSFYWWEPAPDTEKLLQQFAARIAGKDAGPHLRKAWSYASRAIDYSPELNTAYFTGVYFIGPAHPMLADPNAKLPDEFKQFVIPPTGDVPLFAKFYRKMADTLTLAAKEIDEADKLAPKTNRVEFDSEVSNIRWFYRTFRSTANYYDSCIQRDKLIALVKKQEKSQQEIAEAKKLYNQWREVLLDEKQNSIESVNIVKADIRLEPYYDMNGKLSVGAYYGADMIAKKLEILETELNDFLPSIAKRCGITETGNTAK